jgi:hypothetical protein
MSKNTVRKEQKEKWNQTIRRTKKKKKKKKKGGFVFCPRHKILKMLLVLLVAAWCCSARLLSLDADITSERGSSRLVVRRKHTVDGVGVEVELASSSSSSSSQLLLLWPALTFWSLRWQDAL